MRALLLLGSGLLGCAQQAPVPHQVSLQKAKGPTPPPINTLEDRPQELLSPSGIEGWNYGASVVGIGDVDGDGYDDFAVGAPGADDVHDDAGAVFVYMGSSAGVDTSSPVRLEADNAYEDFSFGYRLAGADLNGDGYADLVASAYKGQAYDTAAIHVFYGSESGLSTDNQDRIESPDGVGNTGFGYGLTVLEDMDGDGYPEVAVGSWLARDQLGIVYVYRGGAGGLESTPWHSVTAFDDSAYTSRSFGFSLNSGDLNGDGMGDLIVADYRVKSVYLYFGSPTGLDETERNRIQTSDSVYSFGEKAVSGGDFNGDGYDDLLINAAGLDAGHGWVYFFYGGEDGPDIANPEVFATSSSFAEDFGSSIALVEDLNGDGLDELAIADPGYFSYRGVIHLRYGHEDGPEAAERSESLNPLDTSDTGAGFGVALGFAGDVDGDGYGDLIVGAPEWWQDWVGHAVLFYGRCDDYDGDGVCVAEDCDDEDAGETVVVPWYRDVDKDGYGNDAQMLEGCGQPLGYVAQGGDCNDGVASVSPGSTEIPGDQVDQDCDGVELCYLDWDDDGFRPNADDTRAGKDLSCTEPGEALSTEPLGDCDDENELVNPGFPERCNGIDDDCDGEIDGPNAIDVKRFLLDSDGDGFGVATDTVTACEAPEGYVPESERLDCNDGNPNIFPGAVERRGDEIDQDCDGEAQPSRGCSTAAGSAPGALLMGLLVVLGLGRRRRD